MGAPFCSGDHSHWFFEEMKVSTQVSDSRLWQIGWNLLGENGDEPIQPSKTEFTPSKMRKIGHRLRGCSPSTKGCSIDWLTGDLLVTLVFWDILGVKPGFPVLIVPSTNPWLYGCRWRLQEVKLTVLLNLAELKRLQAVLAAAVLLREAGNPSCWFYCFLEI